MRTVFGIPWVLFVIRMGLLFGIPLFLLLAASEGADSGTAVWWAGIVFIAFCIVHWRDWKVSFKRGFNVVVIGATVSLALCVGGWLLGWAIAGSDSAEFNLAYPSVSAGINEMLLIGYVWVALGHAAIEAWLSRRAA